MAHELIESFFAVAARRIAYFTRMRNDRACVVIDTSRTRGRFRPIAGRRPVPKLPDKPYLLCRKSLPDATNNAL
jgi:hypothetical protein